MKKLALLLGIIFCSNLFAAAAIDDVQAASPTPHPIIWNMGALNEEALIGLDVSLIQRKNHLAAPLYVMGNVSALRIMEIRPSLLREALTYLNSSGFRLLKLTQLDLSENKNISSPLLEKMLMGFSHLAPNLVTLKVQSCGFGAEEARIISQNMSQLTTLDISWNHIGHVGVKSIRKMTNLRTLNISYNAIDSKGAKFISKMGNLRELDIGNTLIGPLGAAYISGMGNLTVLDIRSNNIGDAGAESISRMPHLTTLHIGGNYIEDAGRAVLREKLFNTGIFL